MDTPQPSPVSARIIIPAYKYPTLGIWPVLADHSPAAAPGYVICNISGTGPGELADGAYSVAITNAITAGWTLLGYVDTNYARRSPDEVAGEIYDWKLLYNVTSIFFDQVDNKEDSLTYYAELMSRVRTNDRSATVVLDMGSPPNKYYLNKEICDAIIVFEGPASTFVSAPPPHYEKSAVSIGHIVYGADKEDYQDQLLACTDLGATLVYITDENDGLYDSLPSYFAQENNQLTGSLSPRASLLLA